MQEALYFLERFTPERLAYHARETFLKGRNFVQQAGMVGGAAAAAA